ncbi:PspC domain-containing protein [Methanomicrobium mobile]|uniref:PspC domain-containing protein n=1 Tax=Methanomicrobium mobile TaxID=2205 RepID=UPI0005B2B842|nr:PspC domain-containing protein [Methanomicrobium mobile]
MDKLYRSKDDRMIAGVCGGLGKNTDIDSNLIRILFIVLAFCSVGIMVLIYLCAWILIPEEGDAKSEVIDAEYRIKE